MRHPTRSLKGLRRTALVAWALFLLGLFQVSAPGQETSTPAPDKDPKKPAADKYEFKSEFEVGGTFVDIHGSREKYRTDVNLRPGVHLLNFDFDLRPAEGSTSWFDVMTLHGGGFGDVDPYENARFSMRRNGRYEFHFNYAKDNYYFSVPDFALGLHSDDTLRRTLDLGFDYYLRPNLKLILGYGQTKRSGDSFTSDQIFLDVMKLVQHNRVQTDDYRIALEWETGPFGLFLEQGFRKLKVDTELNESSQGQSGAIPPSTNFIDSYYQHHPTRTTQPTTMVSAKFRPSADLDLNGRYEYGKANMNYSLEEKDRIRVGLAPLEQYATHRASADEPEQKADFNASWFFLPRVGLHNSYYYNRYEITGDVYNANGYRSPGATQGPVTRTYDDAFTHYSRSANETELEVELARHVNASGGFRYSDRVLRFQSVSRKEDIRDSTVSRSWFAAVTGHSGKRWRVTGELEVGTRTDVLLRTEALDFSRYSLRAALNPSDKLQISGSLGIRDDENDTPGNTHEYDNTEFSLQATWIPKAEFLLDLAFGRSDIFSATDVYFYLTAPQSGILEYETNTNYLNALFEAPLHKRVRGHLGYQFLQDSSGTYPLTYHRTDAGLSFEVQKAIWFNLGWKYYAYNEDLLTRQDYAGHLLSVSMRFGF